jgi:hypothetical protein
MPGLIRRPNSALIGAEGADKRSKTAPKGFKTTSKTKSQIRNPRKECEFVRRRRRTALKTHRGWCGDDCGATGDRHAECRRRRTDRRRRMSSTFVHQTQLVTAQPGFSHWHHWVSRDLQNVYGSRDRGSDALAVCWRRLRLLSELVS